MAEDRARILILGGGFGGVAVAQALERALPRDLAELHLVSLNNFLLFHPMLPEVAAGGIETRHILSPLRELCPRTTITVAEVKHVDLGRKTVQVVHGRPQQRAQLSYDQLVIAMGAVTRFSEIDGIDQHAWGLKTVGDALHLRNHVLRMLEDAESETDAGKQRELLTFVVAGGGFSGVEAVAELNDLVREAVRRYPRIDPTAVRAVLLHAGERILPELSEDLARRAHHHLGHRGVEIRLGTRLVAATAHEAVLPGGEILPSRTIVCTVGTAPNPVVASLPCEKDARGRVVVTASLDVPGWTGVWAVGDCAAVPNAASGVLAPPTAQFAQREGELVAHNIVATLRGGQHRVFSYPGLGQFVSLGHRCAVAQVLGLKLSGFFAWWLWRTVYLAKLPRLSRKLRVALDWTMDLVFGRDGTVLPLERWQTVERAHYQPGDVVFRQGDVGELFYIITHGEVEVVREEPDGSETPLTRLRQGDYFGESSLLRPDGRRSATIRALTPVNVVTMARDEFALLAASWASLHRSLTAAIQAREAGPTPTPGLDAAMPVAAVADLVGTPS